ncbi:MAG: SAM-dependent methyltransferase [Anaerolineae bacterium]
MGTLYIVCVPEKQAEDLTLRARRILSQLSLCFAENQEEARHLLTSYGLSTPVREIAGPESVQAVLQTEDVALLYTSRAPHPTGRGLEVIHSAIADGFPIASVPGPGLGITTLVLSGLPSDRFVYLGELPVFPSDRRELLTRVGETRSTLVALDHPERLSSTLVDLLELLGDRPLVVAAETPRGVEVLWRGTIGQALAHPPDLPVPGPYGLAIGGQREGPQRWEAARLRAEVEACLARRLGPKEIGRQLAGPSGWPRREIYRVAAEVAGSSQNRHPGGSLAHDER